MSVSVKATTEITSGSGLWGYQEYEADGDYNDLVDVGMVKDSKLTVTREFDIIEDGEPLQEVKRTVNKETGLWECILGEDIPEEKIMRLGGGSLTETAKQESVSFTKKPTLIETAFESLWVTYKGNEALTKSDFTVQTDATTPVPYSEDDFEIGNKYGMLAIRRAADSTIENREKVQVLFDADVPGFRTFKFGGDPTTKEYYFRHGKKTDDGDMKYIHMWRVASPGKDVDTYPSKGVPQETYGFNLMSDPTKSEGEQIYWKDYEDERITV